MFAKFYSHLGGGTQITRVLGIPGGYPGIPKTRQPYLEGVPISLGIWVWGYRKHGDTQITVTALSPLSDLSQSLGQANLFIDLLSRSMDAWPKSKMQ